jgi:hypothetical protein
MAYIRIEDARAQGLLDDTSAIEIALTLSALGQGLISMHRAGRFASATEFRKTYRRAMQRSLQSFFKVTPGKAS